MGALADPVLAGLPPRLVWDVHKRLSSLETRPRPPRGRPHTRGGWGSPVIALRISVAAASLISSDACSLYQAVWGVQMRFGASFRGP